jgi:hypothetical protein
MWVIFSKKHICKGHYFYFAMNLSVQLSAPVLLDLDLKISLGSAVISITETEQKRRVPFQPRLVRKFKTLTERFYSV